MNCKVIAIGASTGGVNAIREILSFLPADLPPILIVQHMPLRFTEIFAKNMNEFSKFCIKEALDGDIPKSGQVLIAPAGKHMELVLKNFELTIHLSASLKVHYQRPSIDVLFKSVALCAEKNAIGIILTGMGKDGAVGLLEMKLKGAYTIAQDEETSIVYGMPKEAVNLGAAIVTVPLSDIPSAILKALKHI